MKRGFASDNNAGIHPEVLSAIERANREHVPAYGDDPLTQRATEAFKREFGEDAAVFFVFNGTAANVLGLQCLLQSHQAVICSHMAHIEVDECGAPERLIGCKLIPVHTADGKLTPELILPVLRGVGDTHHVQPKVISIAQSSEVGTVYQPSEIKKLADFAHDREMFLHMDGARISNAAASLDCTLSEASLKAGVDVLSFGGTKNGMMGGEAVIIRDPARAREFQYLRKQSMQLGSKMRFVSAQFIALLTDELWRKSAAHANQMAQLLEEKIRHNGNIKITQKVEANAVFAKIPRGKTASLQKHSRFYVWDEAASIVRWMTAFDTTQEDVEAFAHAINSELSA